MMGGSTFCTLHRLGRAAGRRRPLAAQPGWMDDETLNRRHQTRLRALGGRWTVRSEHEPRRMNRTAPGGRGCSRHPGVETASSLVGPPPQLAEHLHEAPQIRLWYVGKSSGFNHCGDFRRIGRGRKRDDGHVGRNLFDQPGCLDSAHSWHGQIHDHYFGLQPGDEVDGLFSIRSLSNDFKCRFGHDGANDAPDSRVVVDDKDSQRRQGTFPQAVEPEQIIIGQGPRSTVSFIFPASYRHAARGSSRAMSLPRLSPFVGDGCEIGEGSARPQGSSERTTGSKSSTYGVATATAAPAPARNSALTMLREQRASYSCASSSLACVGGRPCLRG